MSLRTNMMRLAALGLILAVALTALYGGAPAQAQGKLGKLRFVHAVSDAPAVDIYVDNVLAARGLAFGEATRYLGVQTGPRLIAITATGSTVPLFQASPTISGDIPQTIVAQGTAAALEVGVYDDELAPTRAGGMRITAIHAIKDAPPVDIIGIEGDTQTPLIQGLSYGQPYGTLDLPAAVIDLAVVASGADVSTPVVRLDKQSLAAGTYNMVVALGTLGGTVKPSALLLTATTDAENPANSALVRLVHASPDAPSVDVYVGDVRVAPSLTYGVATPHIALPAGNAPVAVRVAGSPATSVAVLTSELTLTAGSAVTVAVYGPAEKLAVAVSPDNVTALDPKSARVHVVNATDGVKVSAALTADLTAANDTLEGRDVPAGIYSPTVSVDGAALPAGQSLALHGGVLYDLIVMGPASDRRVVVAATGLNEQPGSVPPAEPVAVAANPTATPAPVEPTAAQVIPSATPASALPTAAPLAPTATSAPQVFLPTAAPSATPAPVQATLPPPPVATEPAPTLAPSVTPFGQSGITAQVNTDPGVNLKLREYPITDSKTLALVPSGTTLRVDGVKGPAQVAGQPTPSETATLSAEGVRIEDLWVFVTWSFPDGGRITGWTKPQFLLITNERGRRVEKVEDIVAFPQIPENEFGTIDTGEATPIALDDSRIIGTVNVDPGVNLQLRRTPGIDGESITLIPAGAELTVIEKTEIPSQGGLVGEPQSTIWLFVRFQTDSGSVTGWVNSQFIVLTQRGKPVDIEDIPTATEIQRGGVVGNPVIAPPATPSREVTALIDKLDPGVNLQLRRAPDPSAESLGLIPGNTAVPVLGRNGAGTWLFVRFNDVEGWINAGFVTVTLNGRRYDIAELQNVTDEPDTVLTPTVPPTPSS